MRVLLIDVNCKYSSTGRIVYDLYNSINEHDHVAAVCYGRGPKIKGEKRIYKFGIDFETYIHAALARITGYNGCFSPLSTYHLIQYIDRFKPDIIHIHELHAYFVNYRTLLEYIKNKGIKVLWTFHCEYMYTGKCGHAKECVRYKEDCGSCPAIREYPKSLFFDRTAQMLKWKKQALQGLDMTIAAPSNWMAERTKGSFLREIDVKVIHNGIDTDVFSPAKMENLMKLRKELNIPENHKVVLSVAANIRSNLKGGNYVIELANQMKEENISFVLVGDNEDKEYRNVRIVKAFNNPRKLALFYSMADVFVICSKRENYPTTCLEAQCCGTPVAGFDTGGTRETLIDSELNSLVSYGDIENLSKEVRRVLVENADRIQFSQKAKKQFDNKEMCQNYIELMKAMTNK